MRRRSAVYLGVLLGAVASVVRAVDHKNLDESRPLRIEDPYTIADGEWALEAGGGFSLGRKGPDRGFFPLQLLYGAFPNFQLELGSRLWTSPRGLDEGDKSGDVEISGLYNFNQETIVLPALGLKLAGTFPSGVESSGADIQVKGLMTKSCDRLSFHFNPVYERLNSSDEDERADTYQLVVGASYPIGAPRYTRTTLILDAFTEPAARRHERDIFGAEVGVRHQASQRVVLDLGIGSEFVGPSDRSDFLLSAGLSVAY